MPRKKIALSVKTRKKKIVTKGKNFIDGEAIRKMFSKKMINHIAKTTGFIKRRRKLDVYEFFFFNLWGIKNRHHESQCFG